jgi:non-ribosomal peptide synthetase component E (peptide arylation enzyme)
MHGSAAAGHRTAANAEFVQLQNGGTARTAANAMKGFVQDVVAREVEHNEQCVLKLKLHLDRDMGRICYVNKQSDQTWDAQRASEMTSALISRGTMGAVGGSGGDSQTIPKDHNVEVSLDNKVEIIVNT